MLGEGISQHVRVLTSYPVPNNARASLNPCPLLTIDGKDVRMKVRTLPGTTPARTNQPDSNPPEPNVFDVSSCEYRLPSKVKIAKIGTRRMPLRPARVKSILYIGDTGCRMEYQDGDYDFQDCRDPNAWPWADLAKLIAKAKPDVVLMSGDLHYRDSPCPVKGTDGKDWLYCQGLPWGYGSESWMADFFHPAAPLLAVAPWIVGRGNHEICTRAGQGWHRFFDLRPYDAANACIVDTQEADALANTSPPYIVKLGDTQIMMFDSSAVPVKWNFSDPVQDATFKNLQAQLLQLEARARASTGIKTTLFNNHQNTLAYSVVKNSQVAGQPGMIELFKSLWDDSYFPDFVDLVLESHVHNFQALSFQTDNPGTFISGFTGVSLYALPENSTKTTEVAPGVVVDEFAFTRKKFGFVMMDKKSDGQYLFKVYDQTKTLLTACDQQQRALTCTKTGHLG
jgi:hypothetical protein